MTSILIIFPVAMRCNARNKDDLPVFRVQHHHAHIAACMADNGLDGSHPVIGLAFDGTGYGDDGAIWGGEFLVADYSGYQRPYHLDYFPLPGGDAAIKRPARTALALLWRWGWIGMTAWLLFRICVLRNARRCASSWSAA